MLLLNLPGNTKHTFRAQLSALQCWEHRNLHVVADGVGENHHAALALLQLFGCMHCCSHGCAWTTTYKEWQTTGFRYTLYLTHLNRERCAASRIPHRRPSSLISIRDMVKDSSSLDLYQLSTTWDTVNVVKIELILSYVGWNEVCLNHLLFAIFLKRNCLHSIMTTYSADSKQKQENTHDSQFSNYSW